VFFASGTPLNPFGKRAATVHDESRRGGRAEGAAQSTEGKESHLADVTACAADWSGMGGPTRERARRGSKSRHVSWIRHALELGDNSFDIAGSQFGVMLFPDMPNGHQRDGEGRPAGRPCAFLY
jgi:hypothetical protein